MAALSACTRAGRRPPGWAQSLPGYGATRVLLDGALTETFDESRSLLMAAGWVLALAAAAAVQIRYGRAIGIGS